MTKYQYYYKRNLPHYQPPGATFFITFRLYGSLPFVVIQQLEELKNSEMKEDLGEKDFTEYFSVNKAFALLDKCLDNPEIGPQWLKDNRIVQMVSDSIHYRDGKQYRLDAFCIMPNHVHLVITPLMGERQYFSLAEILQSLKGYTARKANQILCRSGFFWQHESYDHAVRNEQELLKIVQYVLDNPVKAGLKDQRVYSRW